MLRIQIILLLAIGVIGFRLVSQYRQRTISRHQLLLWLGAWTAAAVVIAVPNVASVAAALVGITRGADLVVYCGLMVAFYSIFRLLIRSDRQEQTITKLTQHIALRDYHLTTQHDES